MYQFRVTFQQLKSAIDQLTQLNSQFKSSVENLESTETRLCGMWEGSTRDKFDAEFKKDKGQMDAFYNAVQQYITVLQNALEEYTKAEQINTEIATTRTYK